MATVAERRARRARARVVQRRRRLLVLAGVGIVAVAAGLGWFAVSERPLANAIGSRGSSVPRNGRAALALPGPFHGYLLIADRGNNRMLLVNGKRQILWEYPKQTPGMPFRFDDDTFFGPNTEHDHLEPGGSAHDSDHRVPVRPDPLAIRAREPTRRRPRLPEHPRRRLSPAERSRFGGGRVQLPGSLHREVAPDRASSTAQRASAGTIRRPISAQ